jgi:hypothetical protein
MSVVRFPPIGARKQGQSPSRGKATGVTGASRTDSAGTPYKRKLIGFGAETWHALHLLARDSMKSLQEISDEAFADVLKKHHRPTGLKEALRESARRAPANDPQPVDLAGKAEPPKRSRHRRRKS